MDQIQQLQPTIAISGSFRKHFNGIQEKINEFEKQGVRVLSPRPSKVTNQDAEFVILETDGDAEPKTIAERHLDAIHRADALYIYNPDGYVGASATMELGWALALGKPVYAKEESKDFTLKLFCGKAATPEEIKNELLEKQKFPVSHHSSLEALQKYVSEMAVQRGFADETPAEIMLLMMEEVGELAKALRKNIGLKIDQEKKDKHGHVGHELADIFIYLLHLANACNVDLFKAFQEKELENSKRVWE